MQSQAASNYQKPGFLQSVGGLFQRSFLNVLSGPPHMAQGSLNKPWDIFKCLFYMPVYITKDVLPIYF